ncbi:MAG: PEP-CTERM sorting domain-containing protein [Coraliomargaritaceae bacterium]
MKTKLTSLTALFFSYSLLSAVTTNPSSSVYSVTEGVNFIIGNTGAIDFTISWEDSNGFFGDPSDPTLILTAGQTYTFQRSTSAHPFIITDDTLPVSGTDGSYARTAYDSTTLNNALLGGPSDLDTFVADPGPNTSDLISWTPTTSDIGDNFYYTCYVTGHPDMTGRISVVPEPATVSLWISGAALLFAIYLRGRKQ